jgi:hypothetical protein
MSVSSNRALSLLGAMLLVAGALPAFAHHAFSAEFDADKPLDLQAW